MVFASDSVTNRIGSVKVTQLLSEIRTVTEGGLETSLPSSPRLKHLSNAVVWTLLAWRRNARILRFIDGTATQLQHALNNITV